MFARERSPGAVVARHAGTGSSLGGGPTGRSHGGGRLPGSSPNSHWFSLSHGQGTGTPLSWAGAALHKYSYRAELSARCATGSVSRTFYLRPYQRPKIPASQYQLGSDKAPYQRQGGLASHARLAPNRRLRRTATARSGANKILIYFPSSLKHCIQIEKKSLFKTWQQPINFIEY